MPTPPPPNRSVELQTPPPPSSPSRRILAQRRRRQTERAMQSRQVQDSVQLSSSSRRNLSSTHHTQRRRQQRRAVTQHHSRLPLARRSYTEPNNPLSFGHMTTTYTHCTAFHWLAKRLKGSSISSPVFSICCHHGKVRLEKLRNPPNQLRTFFTANSTQAKEFCNSIRQYNSALAFTSFTAKEQDVNAGGGGPWVWKTEYTIYHRAGSILPYADRTPTYAQLYFYDPIDALNYRINCNNLLNCETMDSLQALLHEVNHYTIIYTHAFEILQTTPSRDLGICILADPSTDLRR